MSPVNKDMTIVAVFEKSVENDGVCTLNCDTNKDGLCDLNCDKNGDGKPDTNIDKDGDGKPDLNVDKDHDGTCDYNCDTNNDGKCDQDCEDGILLTKVDNRSVKFDCFDKKSAYAFFKPSVVTFIYLKFDGKNIDESEFVDDGNGLKKYYYTSYIGSGKTVKVEFKVIVHDGTGQKYYSVLNHEFTFEGDCDSKNQQNNNVPTIDDDNQDVINYSCDSEHFVSLPYDEVKSATIDGKEVKPSSTDIFGYPVYDLSGYKGSGKTVILKAVVKNENSKEETITGKLVFASNCSNNNQNAINVEFTGGNVLHCGEYNDTNLSSPISFLVNKGLKINDNSKITLLEAKPASQIEDMNFNCYMGTERIAYVFKNSAGFSAPTNAFKKYVDSNRGKSVIHKCVFEVITDGQKYIVTRNFKTTFDGNCTSETKKTYTLTYNANGGSVSPTSKTLNDGATYGNLPTPTRSGYTFNGWYTSKDGGSKVSSSTTIKSNTTIYAHWTKIEEKDNGTISLSASKSCLIGRNSVTLTATVKNAKDSTVTWTKDSCLTLSGSGNTRTVTGNNCGTSPRVTVKLNNGATSTVTLNYEPTLTYTVYDNTTVAHPLPAGNYYEGYYELAYPVVKTNQNVTFSADVPSHIKSSTSNSVSLKSERTTLTIKTACNQQETLKFIAKIN